MSFEQDVLKSAAPAYVELFEVDCSMLGGELTTYYLTNSPSICTYGIDELGQPRTYFPFPVMISGVEMSSEGAPPRPKLEIANLRDLTGEAVKLFGTLAFLYDDLVGIPVTYIRTFDTYLNLTSRIGIPLKYYIGKKLSHNRLGLSFELRSPLDKERAFLPKRQMLRRDFPGLSINKHIG